jgi:hypothetical protein
VFFPHLISGAFSHGLAIVFVAAAVMSLAAAVISAMGGRRYVHDEGPLAHDPHEREEAHV